MTKLNLTLGALCTFFLLTTLLSSTTVFAQNTTTVAPAAPAGNTIVTPPAPPVEQPPAPFREPVYLHNSSSIFDAADLLKDAWNASSSNAKGFPTVLSAYKLVLSGSSFWNRSTAEIQQTISSLRAGLAAYPVDTAPIIAAVDRLANAVNTILSTKKEVNAQSLPTTPQTPTTPTTPVITPTGVVPLPTGNLTNITATGNFTLGGNSTNATGTLGNSTTNGTTPTVTFALAPTTRTIVTPPATAAAAPTNTLSGAGVLSLVDTAFLRSGILFGSFVVLALM
ncbi:hypothetical protein HK102_005943 [Quaeritorhiza haematococci]|nr:hypothetical protein HK102_005943 [Quaeritorhiza haematococci]